MANSTTDSGNRGARRRTLDTAYQEIAASWARWGTPFDVTLGRISRSIAKAIGVARVSAWRLQQGRLECLHLYGTAPDRHARGQELHAGQAPAYFRALDESRVIAAQDAGRDARTRELSNVYLIPSGIGAMLATTLRKGGIAWGVLCLEHVGGARIWTPDEKRFAASVADLLSEIQAYDELRRNQERLRELSALQEEILNAAGYGIVLTEVDGIIRSMNASAERMFGYTAAELAGRQTPAILYVADELELRARDLSRELGEPVTPGFGVLVAKARRGVTEEREWTGVRRDGTPFPAQVLVTALRDAQGGISGFLSIASDITARKQAECFPADSEHRYRAMFDAADDGIFVMHTDRFIDCNAAALRMFGCTREQIINETLGRFSPEYQADGRLSKDKALEKISAALQGQIQTFEWRHVRYDGTPFEVEVTLIAVELARQTRLLATVRDITRRKRTEAMLLRSEERLRSSLENTPNVAVRWCDMDGRVRYWNKASEKLYGWSADEAVGRTLDELIQTPQEAADFLELLKRIVKQDACVGPQEFQIRRRDGTAGIVAATIFSIPGENEKPFFVCMDVDVTDSKRTERELEYRADHDPLTGLPNRLRLHHDAGQAIAQAGAGGLTLMLLDLDRFKEVNDTLGHHTGDLLLGQVATCLEGALQDRGAGLYRLGGDEFAVLVPGVSDAQTATQIAEFIGAALRRPFEINGVTLELGGSIGIAFYPIHGRDSHALLRTADVAMYNAKSRAAGMTLYDPSLDAHNPRRLAMMAELGTAIREAQLLLHYQPTVDLASGRCIGCEALVRWQHPRLGLVPPGEFIPLAEMSELIRPLSLWVIRNALLQLKDWNGRGMDIGVAANLSARNLLDLACVEQIVTLLKIYQVRPDRLLIEITESALISDPERALEVLGGIAKLGVRLIIDDFGTGYSSLAYLKRLPLDALKIDRSFVKDMLINEQDAIIVRSTIALAHSLGLKVVAEGVENAETASMLRGMGCDQMQGFHLCRPLPPGELMSWLTVRS